MPLDNSSSFRVVSELKSTETPERYGLPLLITTNNLFEDWTDEPIKFATEAQYTTARTALQKANPRALQSTEQLDKAVKAYFEQQRSAPLKIGHWPQQEVLGEYTGANDVEDIGVSTSDRTAKSGVKATFTGYRPDGIQTTGIPAGLFGSSGTTTGTLTFTYGSDDTEVDLIENGDSHIFTKAANTAEVIRKALEDLLKAASAPFGSDITVSIVDGPSTSKNLKISGIDADISSASFSGSFATVFGLTVRGASDTSFVGPGTLEFEFDNGDKLKFSDTTVRLINDDEKSITEIARLLRAVLIEDSAITLNGQSITGQPDKTPFTGITVSVVGDRLRINGIDGNIEGGRFTGIGYAEQLGLDERDSNDREYRASQGNPGTFLERLQSANINFDVILLEYNDERGNYTDGAQNDIRDWVKGKPYIYITEFNDADKANSPFASDDVASDAYVFSKSLQDQEIENVFVIADKVATLDNKAMRLAGVYASINWYGVNTFQGAKYTNFPGCQPTKLDNTEATTLRNNRLNFYANYGLGSNYFAEGYAGAKGKWLDSVVSAYWMTKDTNISMIQAAIRAPNIGASEVGVGIIQGSIARVLDAAVTNGSLQIGRFPEATIAEIIATTGNAEFDGNANAGYYIWSASLASRTADDIENRRFVETVVWLNQTGSFHSGTIRFVFREGGVPIVQVETSAASDEEAEEDDS